MKIIIAGSREFDDYDLLCLTMDELIEKYSIENVVIVCGMAKGADLLGHRYAVEHGYGVIEMPADWKRLGNSAGYRRNEDMAKIADASVMFWDGVSKGTKHMLDLSIKYKLKYLLINYRVKE